ncbi:MAG: YncE family protein [bacterium]|nr:YncE family protein [bacterium]
MRKTFLLWALVAFVLVAFYGGHDAYAQLPSSRIAVSCYLGDAVDMIDARTIRVVDKANLGFGPGDMAITKDGKTLVVLRPDVPCMAVADLTGEEPVNQVAGDYFSESHSPVYSADGGRLYFISGHHNTLVELHVPSYKYIRSLPLHQYKPTDLVVSKDGIHAYISHPETGYVTVVNLASWEIENEAWISDSIGGIALHPKGIKMLITLPVSSCVGFYDIEQLNAQQKPKCLGTVSCGQGAGRVKISRKGKVIVINTISNDLSVFDIDNPAGRYRLSVGSGPRDILFSPDGLGCFVANYSSSDVSVVDLVNGRQLGRLEVAKGPRSMVWIP